MSSTNLSRRQFATLPAAAALAGLALPAPTNSHTTLAQESGGGNVPMFRGNPARTGEMPGPGPDPSNGIKVIWSVPLGNPVGSSPAVVDRVVYVGSLDGNLYAINAVAGSEVWHFGTRDFIVASSPAVVDETVYVGSFFGIPYAVDAVTGSEVWHFGTGNIVRSSPAVVDGVVYVGNEDSILYAIDTASGTERWRFITDDFVYSSPAVVDGIIYVGGADGNVYAVDAETGTERWRFGTRDVVNSSPAVVDGVVYVGSRDGFLYAIGADSGLEHWSIATGGSVNSSPAVVDGVVYVGSDDGNLYAFGAPVTSLHPDGIARVTRDTVLRGGPAPTAVERADLRENAIVTITGESETVSDTIWWPVMVDETDDQGWVEADALEPVAPSAD